MSLLANSNAIESGGYPIQRSLRFRSSASAYLSRTPASASNRQTWTWSGWVKRGSLGGSDSFLMDVTSPGEDTGLVIGTTDYLRIYNITSSATQFDLVTTAVFRDPSAWYHIIFVLDTTNATASDRARIYVNGVRQTSFSTYTLPPLNAVGSINSTNKTTLCAYAQTPYYFDGYLAEVNFIDGQALTPSSFGQTDAVTGVWQPLKYMGTYGTNGFYLPFSDNTSATTLAYDKSGNGNNWTPNNISTTAGATYDSMTDVPTLTSATAANYCVPNPLQKGGTIGIYNANLAVYTGSSAAVNTIVGTIGVSSGKWYWECQVDSGATMPSNGTNALAQYGVVSSAVNLASSVGSVSTGWGYNFDGLKINNGSGSAYGAAFTAGDVIGVALDMDGGTITFYKNGTSQGQAYSGLTGTLFPAISVGSNGASQSHTHVNFGQRPFSYTPPTGFVALNTFNLPDPTIKKPNQYMDATTYTGNGGTQSITNGGFQPDFVWMKKRSAAESHILQNSTTGTTKFLMSNSTAAEDTSSAIIQSFDASGFTVGASSVVNGAATTYVGWQWKESATAGFDIVTYTGNGANRTISHSLGVAPSMMIVKSRSQGTTGYTGNWAVWHSAIANTEYLLLNTTNAKATGATYWNSTTPTSSVFSLGTAAVVNNNNDNFVNYLFAEIAGFSKFGSYTGNGSTDGPFVYCGFRPKFILCKDSSNAGDWLMIDTSRSQYNVTAASLLAQSSASEYTNTEMDVVSNGFKFRQNAAGSWANNSGQTYIFAAFAENPFKYSLAR